METIPDSRESRLNPHAVIGLNEQDLDPSPVAQFRLWFEQVFEARLIEPNAMTLATSTPDGVPSARVVLLKGFDERGFVFFTNYESGKGQELAQNPNVALVFFWAALERQVRIVGTVSKTGRSESESYFRSRPLDSQLGAWASQQSQVLANREELERRAQELAIQYESQPIPLPPYWGGFRVAPRSFEFWQGRPSRLHDRFRYTLQTGGSWRLERLSP